MQIVIEILIFFGVIGGVVWNWVKDTGKAVSTGVSQRLEEIQENKKSAIPKTYNISDLRRDGLYIFEAALPGRGNEIIEMSVVFCIGSSYCYRFYMNNILANMEPYMMNVRTCINMVRLGNVTDDTLQSLSGFGYITTERSGISLIVCDEMQNQPRAVHRYQIHVESPNSFRATGYKVNNERFQFHPIDFNNMGAMF